MGFSISGGLLEVLGGSEFQRDSGNYGTVFGVY